MKKITFLEELPDDFGKKGKAFKPFTDYPKAAWQTTMRYASLAGLCLSIISLAMGAI